MALPPNTTTQTSHSIVITFNNVVIGAINSWGPTQDRGSTFVYELGGDGATGPSSVYGASNGAPYEAVPGNINSQSIDVNRFDLFTLQMERAFGSVNLDMLSNQLNAFDVKETWTRPDGSVYIIEYRGCWFTRIGRTISSTGDRIVNVSAQLVYTAKSRIEG